MEPITGTANVTLEGVRMVPAGPPHTFLGMARLLLNGIDPLVGAANCAIPLSFVAGQVVECALKAALSKSGDARRLLAPNLRHDLLALWQLAQTEGLPVDAVAPSWLVTLGGLHGPPTYYIRYSTGINGIVTPPPQELAAGVRQLVEIAEIHVLR